MGQIIDLISKEIKKLLVSDEMKKPTYNNLEKKMKQFIKDYDDRLIHQALSNESLDILNKSYLSFILKFKQDYFKEIETHYRKIKQVNEEKNQIIQARKNFDNNKRS